MKKLLTQSVKAVLLLLVTLVFVQANAQRRYAPLAVGDCQMTIENDVQISPTEMQFDIYLKDTDAGQPFELYNIQAGVLVNTSILASGATYAASHVTGYSQINANQLGNILVATSTGGRFQIKLTAKAGPGCGSGTIILTTGLGSRVDRIRITSNLPFVASSQASLVLTTNTGTNPYPTKVGEYIDCIGVEVIAAKPTGSTYQNIHLNAPALPTVFNVTGGGTYCVGDPGLPVGLDGSQTGVTYTLYRDLLATTTTFAGTGAAFDFTPLQLGNHSYSVKATGPGGTVDMAGSVMITEMVCTPTWSGLIDTDWYNPGNWVGNTVPLATDDVIIPVGCPHYPVLGYGVTVMCHNLDIAGNSTKAVLSGGLTISGTLVVSGNLTITATGVLDCAPGGAVTVNGNLTIIGNLTVETNGSLITNGTVTGSAYIQRTITANWAWHLLSSPVTSQSICNGVFAPLVGDFPGVEWDFYKWWANCPTPPLPAEHWRNLRNSTGGLNTVDFGTTPGFQPTRGYLVAYGPASVVPPSNMPALKVFHGVPITGNQVASFFDIFTECTWDLPGNPFPSAIDWNLVTGKENLMTDYYYVWNENKFGGPGYEFSDGTIHSDPMMIDGFIPSMQGFFVKVLYGSGMQLQIPNSARAHHFATGWLKDQDSRLSVKLSNGTNFDEAYVMFMNNAATGKDRKDAEKLFSMNNGIPQIYSIVDNDQKTALNAMPSADDNTVIPLGIVAPATGEYSITVGGMENFGSLTGLVLEDKTMNYTQNLMVNPVYNFHAEGNEDAGRFLLHFAGTIGINDLSTAGINIFSNEKTVTITCAAGLHNAKVTISNLLGQEIVSQKLNDNVKNQVQVNALKGYYIVKVQSDSSVKTAKVYIN